MEHLKPTAQWISLWLALVFGAILLAAFAAFPGFFPPMSPQMGATQVASFYSHHQALIRLSLVTFNFCGCMLLPFFMVIVHYMKRMATPSQVFAYSFLSAVVSATTLFAIADLFWLIAAFRPERDPQLVMLLNDLAWISFIAPVGMFVAQNACLALAVYLDNHPDPVFPRWVAPFSILTGAAMLPAAAAAVVRTGPLAWNGVVSFWLRMSAYSLFLVVMLFVVWRAIRREEAGRGALPDTPVPVVAGVE